jgi:hypothetical protein
LGELEEAVSYLLLRGKDTVSPVHPSNYAATLKLLSGTLDIPSVSWFSIAVSLLSPLLLASGVWVAARNGSRLLAVVLSLTLAHELMLFTYPVIYDCLSDFVLENEMIVSVPPQVRLKVVVTELLYVFMFMMPLSLLVLKGRRERQSEKFFARRSDEAFQILLLCAGVAIYTAAFMRPEEDFESITQHAEIHTGEGIMAMASGWARGLLALPSLIIACLYVCKPDARRAWRFVAAIVVILVVAYGLAAGLRGRLTWVLSLLVVGAFIYNRRRILLATALFAALLVPISQFLGGSWRSVTLTDLGGQSQIVALGRLYQAIKAGETNSDGDRPFLTMLARRAQGPRNSALLYMWYDEGNGAGWAPLSSSLMALVPRFVWPGKGVGGSTDSTPYGAATFMVRRIGYNAPMYNMGPILASAHAYWEGGYVWVIVAAISTGVMWVVIINVLSSRSVEVQLLYALLMSGSLLIDGFFTALFPIYSYILMFYNTIAGLVIGQWLIGRLVKRRALRRQPNLNVDC